ncbi:hypothetical protein [Bisbaumannia pacifica]|uniref:Uncharacterized protein n=1 Tax=Bisbaumannia pacifica TaxID=77098 RepID=A0A510X657_9GAMM|nr:hypothetical protein [Halomonas pacifica]MBH8579727.1 hypothetical protein [Halomonas pacifica]GEK46914.1 hypothetical protein HPA02_11970 [Halomonas pacifica]
MGQVVPATSQARGQARSILDGTTDTLAPAWSEDDFEPIGHVTFTLPMPPRRLMLQLIGGYFFSSGSGHLASGTSKIGFEIEVEAQ